MSAPVISRIRRQYTGIAHQRKINYQDFPCPPPTSLHRRLSDTSPACGWRPAQGASPDCTAVVRRCRRTVKHCEMLGKVIPPPPRYTSHTCRDRSCRSIAFAIYGHRNSPSTIHSITVHIIQTPLDGAKRLPTAIGSSRYWPSLMTSKSPWEK